MLPNSISYFLIKYKFTLIKASFTECTSSGNLQNMKPVIDTTNFNALANVIQGLIEYPNIILTANPGYTVRILISMCNVTLHN